jgi:hypothetical protein
MGDFEKRLHTKLQQLNSFITSIGTTYADPLSVETLGKLGSSQDGHKHVDTLSDLLAGILADDHPNHPVRQTIKDFLSKLVDHVRNMAHSPTAEIHSKPTFTFGGYDFHRVGDQPASAVHERITTQALDQARRVLHLPIPSDDASLRHQYRHYVQGSFWNDDPENIVFSDGPTAYGDNRLQWGVIMIQKWIARERYPLLLRSHYGDLQFFHAMACTDGEQPTETLEKILSWAKFTYAVGTRPNLIDAPMSIMTGQDVGHVGRFFADSDHTVRTLFCHNIDKDFDVSSVQQRAIGSLLHMIQDSFVDSHVARNSLWQIVEFHSYTHQDTRKHLKQDGLINNRIEDTPGAMQAVFYSQTVLQMLFQRAEWSVVESLLRPEVFVLASDVRPASPGEDYR